MIEWGVGCSSIMGCTQGISPTRCARITHFHLPSQAGIGSAMPRCLGSSDIRDAHNRMIRASHLCLLLSCTTLAVELAASYFTWKLLGRFLLSFVYYLSVHFLLPFFFFLFFCLFLVFSSPCSFCPFPSDCLSLVRLCLVRGLVLCFFVSSTFVVALPTLLTIRYTLCSTYSLSLTVCEHMNLSSSRAK